MIFTNTVYPKTYAHGFVVLCFVVVMQSFIMNSHEVFIHIPQGCFAGTGAIVRLPQCQWSKPDGYGKISRCITTTKHSKAETVCIFLGIYCTSLSYFLLLLWFIIDHHFNYTREFAALSLQERGIGYAPTYPREGKYCDVSWVFNHVHWHRFEIDGVWVIARGTGCDTLHISLEFRTPVLQHTRI